MGRKDKFKLGVCMSSLAGVLIILYVFLTIPTMWIGAYWRHGGNPWLGSFAASLMMVSGALITVSAIILYKSPENSKIFGLIIMFSSSTSLLALGIAAPQDYTSIVIVFTLMMLGMIGAAISITHKTSKN